MPYSKPLMDRYAMQAQQTASKAKTFVSPVDVDAVGAELSLSTEDSRGIANYMQDIGWAKILGGSPIQLVLTPLGFEEIAKLKLSPWRRFVVRHWPEFLVAVGAGLLAGLVLWLLNKIF